ncbi:unnamed protein product, partial [Ixodes hexagonus]
MQLSVVVLLVVVSVVVAKDFSAFQSKPTSPDCPVPAPASPVNVGDPNDCTKFSICSSTISIKVDCPPGQCFNGKACGAECAGCTPAPPPGPPAGVAVAADDA